MKTLDAKNYAIVEKRLQRRASLASPVVGDFVQMLDGSLERFSHDWNDSIQTTDGKFGSSFYLLDNGDASFSGGLNSAIMKNRIVDTLEAEHASFWIFKDDISGAHRGLYFFMPVKVWKYCESVEAAQLYSDSLKIRVAINS
jgi:hypothetical protein